MQTHHQTPSNQVEKLFLQHIQLDQTYPPDLRIVPISRKSIAQRFTSANRRSANESMDRQTANGEAGTLLRYADSINVDQKDQSANLLQ